VQRTTGYPMVDGGMRQLNAVGTCTTESDGKVAFLQAFIDTMGEVYLQKNYWIMMSANVGNWQWQGNRL
jgi:deoxyribodipyrimidine photolyase